MEQLRDDVVVDEELQAADEERIEKPERLNDLRLSAALGAVRGQMHVRRILDLGCGEGRFLKLLLHERDIQEIVGVDVSTASLERAERNLRLDSLPERQRDRIRLLQGSILYRDDRFNGFDVITVLEVIEHLDVGRLNALEHVVFKYAKPGRVVITTPNVEYNSVWENLADGKMRHRDHRFEWTRAQFRTWSLGTAETYGYSVAFQGIGSEDADRGTPTQMAIFDIAMDAE